VATKTQSPRRRGPGRASTIIGHPDQSRIERDLAIGRPLGRIAKKYGVSKDAAFRHKRKLPPQLKSALAGNALRSGQDLEQLRIDESEGLLQNLAAQRARLLIAQDAALEAEQFTIVGSLSQAIHRNLELVGKYLGEFAQHSVQTTVSILLAPEYLDFRSALLRSLQPFPEAARAVAATINQMEEKAARIQRQALAPPVTINNAGGGAACRLALRKTSPWAPIRC
jgi:hypothetical protein